MKRWTLLPLLASLFLAGCPAGGSGDDVGDDVVVPPDPADEGCPSLFRADILPTYEITIASSEWAAMQDEFLNRVQREEQGLPRSPYHPVEFRYVENGERSEPVPGVLLRLKGASSWLETINFDTNPKMQFVIAFNEVDPDRRFAGVRKVELDMPRSDITYLRQRLALSALRQQGQPAQCANNARLVINGEYYGLYSNIERQDKEFLQRLFPENPEGDLWKGGREIKTNEDTFSWARVDQLWDTYDRAGFDALVDEDAAVKEWAAEAVIGDADGYYNGRANFYLYDHPDRGFIWIASDLDTVFADEYLPFESSPVFPSCFARWDGDWQHYELMMKDAGGLEMYVHEVAAAHDRYDVSGMQARVDDWSAQIARAAAEDPHQPFGGDAFDVGVTDMRSYVAARAEYLDAWLGCREAGSGPDEDADGYDMCHDCNDIDATVRPGAPETCNLIDDDCDGRTDIVDEVSVCQ